MKYPLIFILTACALGVAGLSLAYLDEGNLNSVRPARSPSLTKPMPLKPDTFGFSETDYKVQAVLDLHDTVISAGADSAFIIAELSTPSPNTVVSVISCSNGRGFALEKKVFQAVIFRPGDPLKRAVDCSIQNSKSGDYIEFRQAHIPDGAIAGDRKARAVITETENTSSRPSEQPRAPYKFAPYGRLSYILDSSQVKISDNSKNGEWSTAFTHGRTQPANRETGYYGTLQMGSVSKSQSVINLNTKRLEHPIDAKDGRPPYPFMAAVMSGHNLKQSHFKYGSIEWVARMPSQKGTWPALWLLPRSGWPPEIDVYEGFSHNSEWRPSASLSSAIHGGKNLQREFQRSILRLQVGDIGIDTDLTKSFNRYQVRVTPDWITTFVNDIETARFANIFDGEIWYPLMTVAVRTSEDKLYDENIAKMEIKSMKVWQQN